MEHHIKGKILDVGCGAGRHVLYFQNKGFDILGIDTSHLGIQVYIDRGCKKVREIDIYKINFAENTFDTILLFGQNIGIGGTLEGVKKLLTLLKAFLKENGTLVLTSLDVTKTDSEIHIAYQKKNVEEGKYIGEVKLRSEFKDKIGNWFNWIHVEPNVLQEIALTSGWKPVEIHNGENGEYSAVLKTDTTYDI